MTSKTNLIFFKVAYKWLWTAERERKRSSTSWFTPKGPEQAMLCQAEIHPCGSPTRMPYTSTLAILYCSQLHLTRSWLGSGVAGNWHGHRICNAGIKVANPTSRLFFFLNVSKHVLNDFCKFTFKVNDSSIYCLFTTFKVLF